MRPLARVELTEHPDAVVIRIAGEIDLSNVDRLRARLLAGVGDAPALVLDLSDTTHLDSTGIRLLLQVHETLRARRRSIRLVVPDGALIGRVIRLTGLHEQLPVDPDIGAAVGALHG